MVVEEKKDDVDAFHNGSRTRHIVTERKEASKKNGIQSNGAATETTETTTMSSSALDATTSSSKAKQMSRATSPFAWIGWFLRILLVDFPLATVFALYVFTFFLQTMDKEYLRPQLELMSFAAAGRDMTDVTYYHRVCTEKDLTTKNVNDLVISPDATTEEARDHMLYHGASMYPNLVSESTAKALRDFIVVENKRRKGFYVIQNDFRSSWGIDINMHPAIQTYWKELASNLQFVQALEAIVGPNPAIVEFTAITSMYGALDQHDHQDVIPPGSAAKFGRSFVPTYSLFTPLQDTTKEMGATFICPGSHSCSAGCEEYCYKHSFPLSGNSTWPLGWGALVNQQTTHKGMGHVDKDGPDRVVFIATFAPRPETPRNLETRMIGLGGSYSLAWSQWGHTFHDFVHADRYMTEPQKTLRSMGLIKGKGWNYISVASMRIANDGTGFYPDDLDYFVEEGGFTFLPESWKAKLPPYDDQGYNWPDFLSESVRLVQEGLKQVMIVTLVAYMVSFAFVSHSSRKWSIMWYGAMRLVISCGLVLLAYWVALQTVEQSNWAKDIRSKKAFRLPATSKVPDKRFPATLPLQDDILLAPGYNADFLASYTRILDWSHPGNKRWSELVRSHSQGYGNLTESMQKQLSKSIVEWARQDGRFLVQNNMRKWTEEKDDTTIMESCHVELRSATDPLLDALIRQLDSLWATASWGRWHDKSIHINTIGDYLSVWDDRLARPWPEKKKVSKPKSKPAGVVRSLASTRPTTVSPMSRSRGLPPKKVAMEPYSGAWTKEGDIVECMYQCSYNEWYRGVVTFVNPRDGTFDVEYADGEMDYELHGHCIRAFEPYQVGEHIEVIIDEEFHPGVVAHAHPGEMYDIRTRDFGVRYWVTAGELRRKREMNVGGVFPVGTEVNAKFEGGTTWYPGTIYAVNPDGTFGVVYNDGDQEESVLMQNIRKRVNRY